MGGLRRGQDYLAGFGQIRRGHGSPLGHLNFLMPKALRRDFGGSVGRVIWPEWARQQRPDHRFAGCLLIALKQALNLREAPDIMRASVGHTDADFAKLLRTGLTDLRLIFECRHFDFGVNASDADRCVILMAPDFQPTYTGGCDLCASKMRCDTSAATASRCNVPRRARSAGPANRPPDQDRADRSPAVRKPARPGRHALVLQSPRQPAADQEPQPHGAKPLASPLVGPEGNRREARQRPKGLQPQRRRRVADRAATGKGIAAADYVVIPTSSASIPAASGHNQRIVCSC